MSLENLSEEELEKRREELLEEAENNIRNRERQDAEAVGDLVSAGRNELVTEADIGGVTVKVQVKLDREQRQLMRQLQALDVTDKEVEEGELSEEQALRFELLVAKFLGSLCPDRSESEWLRFADRNGLVGLNVAAAEVMGSVKQVEERVEKFR